MRTLSTAQSTILALQHRTSHLKVEVLQGSTWVDLTDLEGWNWVLSASWGENIDNPTKTADIELRARIESLSLMSFDDDSKINASSTLIDLGVQLRIYTATLGMDQEVASGDWKKGFDGYIDEFEDDEKIVKLRCRDQAGEPMDLFIEDQLIYPASGASDKAENIMQDILDDNTPNLAAVAANFTWNGTTTVAATGGDTSELSVGDWIGLNQGTDLTNGPFFKISAINANVNVTILNPAASSRTIPSGSGAGSTKIIPAADKMLLYSVSGAAATPFDSGDSPSWDIKQYIQQKIHVLEALRIIAQQIGWDVRYSWQSTLSDYALMFFEPDRTKSTPDHTFDKTLYYKISRVGLKRYDVRNVVKVSYDDSTSNVRASVTKTNAASITKYGRRAMELALGTGDQIDSSTEANLLAQAALDDLKEPLADHGVMLPYFWAMELGDLYRWEANDIHYTSDQDLAVVEYKHTFKRDTAYTTVMCRGTVAGGFKRWLAIEARMGLAQASDVRSDEAPQNVSAAGSIEGITVTYDHPHTYTPPVWDWAYTECYVDTGAVADPPAAGHLKGSGRQTRFEIRGLTPGTSYNCRLVMYDYAGNKSATSTQVNATAGKVEAGYINTGGLNGATQIAANLLGTHQFITDAEGLGDNFDFSQWSRG